MADTCREIIKQYLDKNGYDGLYFPGECGCLKDNLFECGSYCGDCKPGYRHPGNDEFDFIISYEKPQASGRIAMSERPILFNTEMVKAILEGRKTQTRRPMKVKPDEIDTFGNPLWGVEGERRYGVYKSPFGKTDDTLWVRETFAVVSGFVGNGRDFTKPHPDDAVAYRADNDEYTKILTKSKAWRPSLHMPREYARIFLKITNVRVERIQDTGQGDACKEGCPAFHEPIDWFSSTWDLIYKSKGYGWDANPYVWVYEFEREEG